MFNLGRILTGLATLAAVLVGAALGAPALMNWDRLRAPVEARAQAMLGVPVRVDGRITVQLLPSPAISLSDVVVAPGADLGISGDFGHALVHLKLRPLLSGKAVPAALEFSGADLLIDRRAAADGRALAQLSLPVTVSGGRARFDSESDRPDVANIEFKARPEGAAATQVRLRGTYQAAPFDVRAAFGGSGPGFLRFVGLDFGEGQASLSFVRAETGKAADVELKLTQGEKAAAFLARFLPPVARVVKPEQLARLGPLAVAMRAEPVNDGIALRGVEVTAGPLRLTGEGRLRPGSRFGLNMDLGARTLVLGGGKNGFDPSGLLRVIGLLAEWGEGLDGGIRLHADHILAGGTVLRQGEIHLFFGAQGTRLGRFRIALPHDISVSGQGVASEAGQLAAAVRMDGARLDDLIGGLSGTDALASAAQTPLILEGRLALSGARAALNNVRIEAGRNVLNAEGTLFLGERPSAEVRLEGGEIDLRPYGLSYADLTSELSANDIWSRLTDLSSVTDVTARVELGKVRLTDAALRDGVVDLTLDRRQLVLRRLSLGEEGGRSIEARLRMPIRAAAPSKKEGEGKTDWIARAEAAIDVRAPGKDGLTWRAGLWDGILSLETETPIRSRLSGALKRTDAEFRWSDIRGRIGRAAVNAELSYAPGERPILSGIVHTDKAHISLAGGEGENLWPAWPLASYWPRGVDIHVDWSADSLEIAGAQLSDAEGIAVLEKSTARLDLVSGKLFSGAATGTASLTIGQDGLMNWDSQALVQRADLSSLFGGNWQGRGTIRQSTSSSGKNIWEIVSGLRGTVGVNFDEGQFGGLDAAALATSLAQLDSAEAAGDAISQAFGGGVTPFRRLEGEAKVGNGELVLTGISAQGPTGPVMLAGIVNLRARLIAAQADISLGENVGAPLSVQFIGRMEAPERMVDAERLTKRLMQ